MKINICGIEHEILERPESDLSLDTHMGLINYGEAKIYINEDMANCMKEATICHEILHGMLVHIGREDLSEDEQFVTALGNAINATFKLRRMSDE